MLTKSEIEKLLTENEDILININTMIHHLKIITEAKNTPNITKKQFAYRTNMSIQVVKQLTTEFLYPRIVSLGFQDPEIVLKQILDYKYQNQ